MNHRAFLPASREEEYFKHLSRYAYLEWLGMDEQLQQRVNVSLKDTLTAIAETCSCAYGWKGEYLLV